MIRHTVAFRLKHRAGSPAELDFLSAARGLALLPGVKEFECLRQIGKKNAFTFALSMEFADDPTQVRKAAATRLAQVKEERS